MNLRELLEQSHLDALGMLDPEDRVKFQRGFDAAAPAVRSQIRDEQERMATRNGIDSENYSAIASVGLRGRVITLVRGMMLDTQIAQSSEAGGSVVTRSEGFISGHLDVASDAERDVYDLKKAVGVSWLWRAGSIGLAGVCAVLAVSFANVLSLNSDMKGKIAESGLPKQVTVALGSDRINDTLFNTGTTRDVFVPIDAKFAGLASLLHNSDWDDAVLSSKDLPELVDGGVYRVVVLDASGNQMERLAEIGKGGEKGIHSIKLSKTAVRPGTTLAIVATSQGVSEVVLKVTLA